MAKRGGKVHIAETRRHYKGTEYRTTLLRRSYREDGKVKNETVGNLSHLEGWMIDGLRAMLAGRRLVDLDEEFEILRPLPHGHVAAVLGVLRELDLERLICRERCRERDLCVAMVCQRLLSPCSKLSTTRLVHQTTLAEELSLGEVTEAELLAAMDWLYERQPRIEKALARRHLQGEGFVLYDLSSSYLQGCSCELAAIGYSRDGKPGKPQISYGLCCAPDGQPISIEVHAGNTGDPTTLGPAVERVKESFGIEHVVFVGDCGMITDARVKVLKEQGVGFITALRAPQIQKLTVAADFQLSLFDEQGLCEGSSPEFPASGWWCVATRRWRPSARASAKNCSRSPRKISRRSSRWSTDRAASSSTRARGGSASAPAGWSTSARWPSTSRFRSPIRVSATSATRRRSTKRRCWTGSTCCAPKNPRRESARPRSCAPTSS